MLWYPLSTADTLYVEALISVSASGRRGHIVAPVRPISSENTNQGEAGNLEYIPKGNLQYGGSSRPSGLYCTAHTHRYTIYPFHVFTNTTSQQSSYVYTNAILTLYTVDSEIQLLHTPSYSCIYMPWYEPPRRRTKEEVKNDG